MNRNMIVGTIVLIVLIGAAGVFLIQHERTTLKQLEKDAEEEEILLKPQPPPQVKNDPQVAQPTNPVHVHEDGTVHEGEHHAPLETPPPDWTPTQVQIPEGITDPDVKAAWERLDYISKNIWEWGGVPSAETEELIKQLMPPPDGFSGPTGHSDAEDTINLLGSLDRNDPRSAEVSVTYLCEGIVGGRGPVNALVEIGPPAVPLLINYLFDDTMGAESKPTDVLGEIAVKYRKELDGIVDHIIIPKFEEIAAIEDPPGNMTFPRKWAREALESLK